MKRHLRLADGARPLGSGLNLSTPERLLDPSESPFCRNFETYRGSALSTGGTIKLNNQVAPTSGVRTKTPGGGASLSFESDRSVPVRGYAYFPWSKETDIGAPVPLLEGPATTDAKRFHGQRGVSFEKHISFRIPSDVSFYRPGTRGDEAPSTIAGTLSSIEATTGGLTSSAAVDLALETTGDIAADAGGLVSGAEVTIEVLTTTADIAATSGGLTSDALAIVDETGGTEPVGRPLLSDIGQPANAEFYDYDLFQHATLQTNGDWVVTQPIQVGHGSSVQNPGQPAIQSGAIHIDPSAITWPTAAAGRRALRFTWSGPSGGGQPRGILAHSGSSGYTVLVTARQINEDLLQSGYVGVEWVEFSGLDLYPGSSDSFTVNGNSNGPTLEQKPLCWWYDDCKFFGTSYYTGADVKHRYINNHYQSSCAYIGCTWGPFEELTEHGHYYRGGAKDWNGGPPFLWYEDCDMKTLGSQHSKMVSRPCTAAIDAQYPPVAIPDTSPVQYFGVGGDSTDLSGDKNPLRSHAVGTPWQGDAIVGYFRCDFADAGGGNTSTAGFLVEQRGPGNIVDESPCIGLLWIEDCTFKGPTQGTFYKFVNQVWVPYTPNNTAMLALDDFKLSGLRHAYHRFHTGNLYPADIWPWPASGISWPFTGYTPAAQGGTKAQFYADYAAAVSSVGPDPTLTARSYAPVTGGTISQNPGTKRMVVLNCDLWCQGGLNQSQSFQPMFRFVDGIGEGFVKSEVEVWGCSFVGEAKMSIVADGLCWKGNMTPAAITRAEGRFGALPSGLPYWYGSQVPTLAFTDSSGTTGLTGQMTSDHFLGTCTDPAAQTVAASLDPTPAAPDGDWGIPLGYDEAFESTCLILQKGGDRQANMSWALGIVNTGENFEHLGGTASTKRVSQYALCFMWLDAPTFGLDQSGSNDYMSPRMMRYALGTESDIETNGTTCTTALRALLIPFFVEPGEDYRVAFGVKLDSGGITYGGSSSWSSAWNEDGKLQIVCQKGYDDPVTFTEADMVVWKGPQDSADYLKKYGVRYSSKDAEFAGLGMRRHINSDINYDSNKQPGYFIPYGHDQAPLEMGGNRLVRRSDTLAADIVNNSALTAQHAAGGDTFLTFNHEGLVQDGTTIHVQGANPLAVQTNAWGGAGGAGDGSLSASAPYHTEALRGYRVIATRDVKDTGSYDAAGAIFSITSMPTWTTAEIQGLPGFVPATTAFPVLIQAFRWNQFPLELSEYRHYREPLDFTEERTKLSLRQTVGLEDELEQSVSSLVAYYPMDDASGGYLRELIGHRSGYLAPFSMGTSLDGTRGRKRVFLSGEGESVCLDLSENPIFEREMGQLLGDDGRGIGIELTMQIPEATYNNQTIAAPVIASWELKDPDGSGLVSKPQPLMRLTAGDLLFGAPAGFALQVDTGSDQAPNFTTVISDNYTSPAITSPWGSDGPWVGKTITLQFGLNPTGVIDEYYAYIAISPKSDINPEDGDDSRREYVARTTVTIPRKQIARSFISIGGQLDTGTDGYDTNNIRLILDEVRISAAPLPGSWPVTMTEILSSGVFTGTNLARTGKLEGANAMPARELDAADILRELGDGVAAASISDGDATVTAPVGQAFFEAAASDTVDAVTGTLLIVRGDTYEIKEDETVGTLQEEFYAISSVPAGGATLELYGPINDATRSNASAASFRLVGYTAFGTDTEEKQLTLGHGKAFIAGTTKAADALISETWWTNQAPVTGDFRVRIFSPLGSGSLREVVPSWTRGVQYPRSNPVLGLASIGETAFATTRGCLYEADDRWREDGPNEEFTRSLEFRDRRHPEANIGLPLHRDYMTFDPAKIQIGNSPGNLPGPLASTAYYETWVYLNEIRDLQTILFVGDLDADPNAGASTRSFNHWIRLRGGRPEFVVGSTATGTPSTPDAGLFVAAGALPVKPGKWTHLRWTMKSEDDVLQVPKLTVNGKLVDVTVSVRDANSQVSATTDGWLQLVLVPRTSTQTALVGAAPDTFSHAGEYGSFTQGESGGLTTKPQDVYGKIHALGGKLCGLGVVDLGEQAPFGADFDHNSVLGGTGTELVRYGLQDGVGHHALSTAPSAQTQALIHSHPAISVNHELGIYDDRSSFASYDNRLFVANGGRVVYTDRDLHSKFSGVRPPSTPADFSLDRRPLWVPNVTGQDPTPVAVSGAGDQINHYDGYGNTYLEQEWHSDMEWKKDAGTSGEYGIFTFKCYWKPRSVSGRVALYTAREGKDSGGPFVESIDGKLVFGWYDTYLKKRVYVETSSPVFYPGRWHYIYVRKAFPQQDGDGGGNWRDSVWNATNKTDTRDSAVVRQFPLVTPGAGFVNYPTIFGKDQVRGAVSFTTDQHGTVPGATATGLVTVSTVTYSVTSGATITAGTAGTFHGDMQGMYFQFGTGANNAGTVYRIRLVTSATTIVVTDLQGATPTIAESAAAGGVFIGISLVPSADYDAATSPDEASYPIRYFGTSEAGSILSGESPASGEFACPAVFVGLTTDGSGVEIFESGTLTDELERGTDTFEGRIFTDGHPNELRADGGNVFSCIDTLLYSATSPGTSTQPNAELEVETAAEASVNAQSAFWQYVQDPGTISDTFRCRVAFYDADQNEISALGPELAIEPSLEDASNPSGSTRLVLNNIPVSREAGDIGRYIYLTTPGGATFHLVRVIPDNSSGTVSIKLDVQEIQRGEPHQWNASVPPRCKLLQVVGQTLVYGNLTFPDAPDAFMYSQSFEPARVPPANFGRFNTGSSRELTALGNIRGYLIAMKRTSVHRALIRNVAQLEDLADYNGCVAHQTVVNLDNQLLWLSELGWVIYRGTGIPIWIGSAVQDAFNDEPISVKVDKRKISKCSAAVNAGNRTIEMAFHMDGGDYMRNRFTLDLDGNYSGQALASAGRGQVGVRHGLMEGPNITTLGTVDRRGGGARRLLGGTEEGFFVWMDRSDAYVENMGPSNSGWGSLELEGGANSTASVIEVKDGVLDEDLEGPRGTTVSVTGPDDSLRVVLAAASGKLLLDRTASDTVSEDDLVYLGSTKPAWHTGWMDVSIWVTDKVVSWLDLEFEGSTGSMYVQIFTDLDDTTDRSNVVPEWGTIVPGYLVANIADGWAQFDILGLGPVRYIKVKIVQGGDNVDQRVELVAIGMRGRDSDVNS